MLFSNVSQQQQPATTAEERKLQNRKREAGSYQRPRQSQEKQELNKNLHSDADK
jgi:hypothetical protein